MFSIFISNMHMHMHMHSTTWFEESLQSLGHYDPLIARKALTDDDDSFRQITLWLEDRVIRLWYVISDCLSSVMRYALKSNQIKPNEKDRISHDIQQGLEGTRTTEK
jgi:hypothetical protein